MSEALEHPMRRPTIEKVVVNMSIGRGGRDLENAEAILESITGQRPVRTIAKQTRPEFNLREGQPVGAKVTLRGETATSFLETALSFVDLSRSQFDETGNISFGIEEHTQFPGQEYSPDIGLYGMDVTVNIVRPGTRIRKRNRARRDIPDSHRVSPEDAMAYLADEFEVTFSDE